MLQSIKIIEMETAMGYYTDFFEKATYELYEKEDYIDELKKLTGQFRTFDEALDSFISEHGYKGSVENVDEKVTFIVSRFKRTGVPVPRNIKKWYTEKKRIERNSKIPFLFCFAFELNVDEADDFFRRICLSKGIDCHLMQEAVYFFALKNRLTYTQTEEILSGLKLMKPDKICGEDLIYTDFIKEDVEKIETPEKLIAYLNENFEKFAYNNAAAFETIQTLWKEIQGSGDKEGLAIKERKQLYELFNKEEAAKQKYHGRRERLRADDSITGIYLQILGLYGDYVTDYYKDRGLKAILKDNALLHPLAEEAFPDRDGLNKILNGAHVSYERVRKLMILLVFYRFYIKRALSSGNYMTDCGEEKNCMMTIDNHLISANYQRLYPGNPYDFLILMAIRTESPLCTFRDYMRELFFENADMDLFYGE